MEDLLFAFVALVIAVFMAGQSHAAPFSVSAEGPPHAFYSGDGSSSPPPSNDHGAPAGNNSGNDRSNTPLGGTPGVQLPALVVPMFQGERQAGYFYLTMALEVTGDDWQVREKVPYIQDALVRYVYAHPIPVGMSEEQALDIMSEIVVAIASDIMGNDQVTGIIYRDVSTGF